MNETNRVTFLTLIAQNKRASILLTVLMCLLIMILGFVIGKAWFGNGEIGMALAFVLSVVFSFISWYGGGDIILSMSGAKQIEKKDHPKLFNVVEEVAIAAGIPMPRIYIIEDTAPNAFATGRDPDNAVVAITRGLLEKLDRDELQGVIAHEIAHIRNFDIRFAMLMAVMVGVIVLLSDFFLRSSWFGLGGRRRDRDSDSGGGGYWFIVALVLAILAPIFAKIIQLAISRKREYLADATAVQFTRYPDGLARALQKIAADEEPLESANRATQHLYIVNPLKNFKQGVDSVFSTHPPIESRIALLRQLGAGPTTTPK